MFGSFVIASAACADKAVDFLKKQGENKAKQLKKEFEDSGKGLKQTVDQNRKNVGL